MLTHTESFLPQPHHSAICKPQSPTPTISNPTSTPFEQHQGAAPAPPKASHTMPKPCHSIPNTPIGAPPAQCLFFHDQWLRGALLGGLQVHGPALRGARVQLLHELLASVELNRTQGPKRGWWRPEKVWWRGPERAGEFCGSCQGLLIRGRQEGHLRIAKRVTCASGVTCASEGRRVT